MFGQHGQGVRAWFDTTVVTDTALHKVIAGRIVIPIAGARDMITDPKPLGSIGVARGCALSWTARCRDPSRTRTLAAARISVEAKGILTVGVLLR
jgi:hypothetical protein